jgi:hypothetical protein
MRTVLTLLLCAFVLPAWAGPVDDIFDDSELARWQLRYPDGVRANFEEVILPALDAPARDALSGVGLRFPLKVAGHEPFAFYADQEGITLSVASIKMLDDLSVALAWLQLNGYAPDTVFEYVHWLKYAAPRSGERLPGPLRALCIPANAIDDPSVDDLAQKILKGQVFFVLAHELGHVLYQHPGYDGVARTQTRRNEAQADSFALDIFARIGEPPMGMVPFFMLTAYADKGRGDFASEADWRADLARRTHPVNEERLRAVAAHLRERAPAYRETLPDRDAVVVFLAIADQVDLIAGTLTDPQMQTFLAGRGRQVSLTGLAPRRPGQMLGAPCGASAGPADFSGLLTGELLIEDESFAAALLLAREGERVIGQFDFGTGQGVLEGLIDGDGLVYRWGIGDDSGRGRLYRTADGYRGTWGYGYSIDDGGAWRLAPAGD